MILYSLLAGKKSIRIFPVEQINKVKRSCCKLNGILLALPISISNLPAKQVQKIEYQE